MKAFVIKNKEGKYYEGLSDNWYDSLDICTYFKDKESAEYKNKLLKLKNCEVVEITIAEGDLEQQLAEKDKEIERLKEELAENEHIIDFHMKNNIYNVALKDYSVLAPYPKNMVQIIRHQVCDEIEKIALLNRDDNYVITSDELDEIRKGE